MKMSNAFKTGKALQWALDNMDPWYQGVDGMQKYCDQTFAYLHFDLDEGSTTHWRDAMEGALFPPTDWMLDGSIDYGMSDNKYQDYDPETIQCEYVDGMYEPYDYGQSLFRGGKEYIYISSIRLPQEMEHQAENGKLAYEYRGSSFVRVLMPVKSNL